MQPKIQCFRLVRLASCLTILVFLNFSCGGIEINLISTSPDRDGSKLPSYACFSEICNNDIRCNGGEELCKEKCSVREDIPFWLVPEAMKKLRALNCFEHCIKIRECKVSELVSYSSKAGSNYLAKSDSQETLTFRLENFVRRIKNSSLIN